MKNHKRMLATLLLAVFLIGAYSPLAYAATNDACMICWSGSVIGYCRGGAIGFESELHEYSGGTCRKWLVHAYTDWVCNACGEINRTTIHACYMYHESCGARNTTYCIFPDLP